MTPRPGDYFVRPITGYGGVLIRLGQWLNGDGFRKYEHAGIVTSVDAAAGTYTTVEAWPGGARTGEYALVLEPVVGVLFSTLGLTTAQRYAIVATALDEVRMHTGYSILDYLAIAAHRFRLPVPFLRKYIGHTGHMICSQLVDWCYLQAGVELFQDGRWFGYVTPGDLSGLINHVRTAS